MDTARVLIEVQAGLIPGTPIPEYTKKFGITSDEWHAQGAYQGKKEEAALACMKVYGLAQEYMRSLWNPQTVNWVQLNWIYL